MYERDFHGEYVGADLEKGKIPPHVICSAESIPFRPNTFDTIVAFDMIEHLALPGKCVSDISFALRKDGLFLATTPNAISPGSWWDFTHKQHFTRRKLASLIGQTFKQFELLSTGYPTLKFAWLRSLASTMGYADSFIIVARKDSD
jgi:SAM-dependent methyltransferase